MLDTTICCGGYGCNDLQDLWREPSQIFAQFFYCGTARPHLGILHYALAPECSSGESRRSLATILLDVSEDAFRMYPAGIRDVASAVANRNTARTGLAQQLQSLMCSWVHRRSSCDEAFVALG